MKPTRLLTATQSLRENAWTNVALAWVVSGTTPVLRVASVHQGFGVRAVGVVFVSLTGCLALRRRASTSPYQLIAWSTLVAALGAAAGGRIVGVWLFFTTVFSGWVFLRHHLPGLGAFDRRATLLAVAPLWPATLLVQGHFFVALLLWAIAWALAGVGTLHGARVQELQRAAIRAIPKLARMVRQFVLFIVLTPLWAAIALIPWLLHRVVRSDPLRPGLGRNETWIPRVDLPERPDRLWFLDPRRDRPRLRQRLHARSGTALGLAICVGLLGLPWLVQRRYPDGGPPPSEALRALAATPTFAELKAATDDAIERIWFSQYAGHEWTNTSSRYLNIRDGRRATWTSNTCSGTPAVIWFFGGSTAFGVLQRDDLTLASELAKSARARGINLRVENWGMPGDVAWQQNRRLERALAGGTTPDAVVHYDGWNDLRAVEDMDFTGRQGSNDFIGSLDRLQFRVLTELGPVGEGAWRFVHFPRPVSNVPRSAVLERASASYRAADDLARVLASRHDLGFLHFYQPSLPTRSRRVPGELQPSTESIALVRSFRDRLPDQVIDLGNALDQTIEPLYYDEVHTLETANPVLAAAMIDTVLSAIDAQVLSEASCR